MGITVLTVVLALVSGDERIDPLLRPFYFLLLFAFFRAIGRRQPELRVLPFRLIEAGFFVLAVGFLVGAVSRALALPEDLAARHFLHTVVERGAVFLLGLSLVSYGVILWVPHLLESQRVLLRRYDVTRGALRRSERARNRMEQRFVDVHRLHAMGELAGGLAHDLRNPLAIVKATAEGLRRSPRSASEAEEHVRVICRNVDRAERTIASLLELGNPRPGTPRDVEVDDVLAEVAALAGFEQRRHGVALDRSSAPGTTARADRRLLVQALLNLVLNAIQASPRDAEVRLRVRRMVRRSGDAVVAIAVEDRGSGLSAEARAGIFRPFFTTRAEGTGLGLLSCRRVLEDMGGVVNLYPRRRGGARAVVLLAAGVPSAGLDPAAAPSHEEPCSTHPLS